MDLYESEYKKREIFLDVIDAILKLDEGKIFGERKRARHRAERKGVCGKWEPEVNQGVVERGIYIAGRIIGYGMGGSPRRRPIP